MIDRCHLTEVHHLLHRHPGREPHRQEFLNHILPFQRRLLLQYTNIVGVVTAHRRHQGPALEGPDTARVTVTVYRHTTGNLWVVLDGVVHIIVRDKQKGESIVTEAVNLVSLPEQFRMKPIRHHHLVAQIRIDVGVTIHREHCRNVLFKIGTVQMLQKCRFSGTARTNQHN